MISMSGIIDQKEHKITEDSIERISILFKKGNISQNLFNDKSNYHILSSDTIQDFLKSYPMYKITTLTQARDCLAIQWTRHYMENNSYGKEIIGTVPSINRLMREIVPQFLKQVFINHPEAFLNDSISHQLKMIEESLDILVKLQSSLYIHDVDLFFSQTLSKVDLKLVANFFCLAKREENSIDLVAKHIEFLLSLKNN